MELLLDNPAVLGLFDDPIGSAVSSTLLAETSSDESFDWGLARIGVPEVLSEGETTGSGVTVAVLDTGIDLSHPELKQKIVSGFNALPGGGSYNDNHGHGTHMAGIIAAAVNSKGIIGAAPQAKLSAVKVLDKDATGRVSDLINGLQWVQKKGIRVANMSLGFSGEMFRLIWVADIPDPDNFLFPLLHSTSPTNRTFYRNPLVDQLLEQARKEADEARRITLYRQVERIAIDDAPWITQHHSVLEYLFQPYVQGVEINLLGRRTMPMKKIWFKKIPPQDSMRATTDVPPD